MPPISQIKNTINSNVSNRKNSSKKFIKYLVIAAIVIGIFRYFVFTKIENIPNEVYENTSKDNQFYTLLTGNKKIVWFGADCPISASRKKFIDTILNILNLDKIYKQQAFLQNSFSVQCKNKYCADAFFIENCGNNFCIVIPSRRKFIKIKDEKKLLKTLQKVKDW